MSSEQSGKVPRYMAQLLEELGWNQGTRIPLASPDNQNFETILIERQNEIQRLKEALIAQNQKRDDLNNYKQHVQSEYHENTRLLFAHKQQLEQEVKLRQLSLNEADRLDRDIVDCNKQTSSISSRTDKVQNSIARLLKKADSLKSEVCGERGALQEWRAALERSSGDITAIEQFTKQDLSKAKALEIKRQKLKLEHDQLQEHLNQVVSNLSAEERACERISVQVMEGMEQRKQMMMMWTNAVENLRQRDTDIRHIREDYAVLETEANSLAEQCREQQGFCDQQRGNNADAQRDCDALAQRLAQLRRAHLHVAEQNACLDSEVQSLQRELSNMRIALEKLHMENRQFLDDQHKRDVALSALNNKIKELKEKLVDSTDKSKCSEKRAKELEDMLNEEERFANQLTVNQQRAMHCSFVEQQKLLVLKNEEKLFHMQLKSSKAVMSKLDTKQRGVERNLQNQKESLYAICYQVETIGSQVSHMEGAQAERECSADLAAREDRLKDVLARHAARAALLERHAARLHDDMRRLARELQQRHALHAALQSRLKTSMLNVEGGEKEVRASRDVWRRQRVEEALMRLRVAHASRALAGLGDAAFTLDKQRLQLDAAMNERLVEISARRDMFGVQRRALLEHCGRLRSEIRERQQRVLQLVKRYDIFIASLGKDEAGQELSVTFFKIKFAAERAELRARGAALDADISRRERDVSALEATLRVLHAAHAHFLHRIAPLDDDTPEMEEVSELTKQYYTKRDELKELNANVAAVEQVLNENSSKLTMITDKYKQLTVRELECENELDSMKERLEKQESRLQKAHEIVQNNARRAKKLIEGVDDWRIFQMSLCVRDWCEAAHGALQALAELPAAAPAAAARLAALLAAAQPERLLAAHQRRLLVLVQRIINNGTFLAKDSTTDQAESVFSASSTSSASGVSIATGFTRRLAAFRRQLAPKVQEKALIDDIREQARRSSISLRVVTLGLEDVAPVMVSTLTSRKSLR
ncbi:coiled-coil domain-containing protein 39 [Vanessa atalanta]|uniref:coiled-coil domain-containing protein 39 n=1 Tax=Vanessa atalanta TaxID=42275 RepID=UPI001FCDF543|nr:coiled-coil domain-containing protein 39 [Vanessa atalanta]